MRNGILAGPLPPGLPGGDIVASAATAHNFSALVLYAIKVNETGESLDPNVISGDGGHGWFQLTASFPDPGWNDPLTNATYAIVAFLAPAELYWSGAGFAGEDLVKMIACEYNAGRAQTIAGHAAGNADRYTTDNYGARAVASYVKMLADKSPFL